MFAKSDLNNRVGIRSEGKDELKTHEFGRAGLASAKKINVIGVEKHGAGIMAHLAVAGGRERMIG